MKKLRMLLAASALASVFVVGGAAPAHANCSTITGHSPCAVVCAVGLSDERTAPLFRWCYVT
ncbi:MAG TPA: hypothetical protein VG318_05010 [Actinomycetota bacterium]|nr:hypothetical protein [Actinomycetota bacterium]